MMTTIQISRPKEWTNRIRTYKIYIDNEKIGDIANGETKDFMVAPGKHTITAKIDWCGSPEVTIDTGSDEIRYLKVSSSKIMKWLPWLALPAALIGTFMSKTDEYPIAAIVLIPSLLLLVIMLTVGRNKYLSLKLF